MSESTNESGSDIITGKTSDHSRYKPYNRGIIGSDYFYGYKYGTIVKYNVHTGKESCLCPDPFCDHENKNCLFFGVSSETFTSIGNIVYYVKPNPVTGKNTMYSFDTDTSETKTVFSSNEVLLSVFAYEYKILIRAKNNYNDIKSYHYWYDTKTGKTEDYDESSISNNEVFYGIRDDRVIWRILGTEEFYSTDLNGIDHKKYDFGYRYGNYYELELIEDEDGHLSYTVYVTYNGESEKTIFLKNVSSCFFFENKIIYFMEVPPEEQKVLFIDPTGREVKDSEGGNIYVINPDGTDNHLLLHADYLLSGLSSNKNHPLICGDYFGVLIYYINNDGCEENGILIANINTGEFVITHN